MKSNFELVPTVGRYLRKAALNFLKGRFAPGNSGSTFGILEIGGASHQNTFENPSKETIDLTVAGKPYHVISKRCISLLGVI